MEVELQDWQNAYFTWVMESGLDKWKIDTPDKHVNVCTALVLTNQQLMNEYSKWEDGNKYIAALREAFPNLLMHKLVSVQPKLGPNSNVFFSRFKFNEVTKTLDLVCDSEDCISRTRLVRLTNPNNPDKWAEELQDDLDKEVLTDLFNNAGTVSYLTPTADSDRLHIALSELLGVIYRKALRKATWMVVAPSVAVKYQSTFSALKSAYNIYVSPLIRNDSILIGCKGERYIDAPYIYSPYIMFSPGATVMDPDSFETNKRFLARYGKKLMHEGAKHYARLTLGEKPKATT